MSLLPNRVPYRTMFDLTRSSFEMKTNFEEGDFDYYEGSIMVFQPRQTTNKIFPSAGNPAEKPIGVALTGRQLGETANATAFGVMPRSSLYGNPFSVVVGYGEMLLYTMLYDPTEQFYLGEQVKAVAGGLLAANTCAGKLIEQSTVISLPIGTEDPYLGVRMTIK